MRRSLLIALSSSFILGGCLTKELPSYTTYSLQLKPTQQIKTIQNNKSIFIAQPKALQSLKNRKIIYNKNLEQNHYALSIWSDEPSKMLQQLMANYLDSTQTYKYVTTSKLREMSDYTIYSELLEFNHVLDTPSHTLFSIRVYIKNNTTNAIESQTFNYKQAIEDNNANNAVVGLNKSVNQFMEDLNGFIQKSMKQ